MKVRWVSFSHSKVEWLELIRQEYLKKISFFVSIESEAIRIKGSELATAPAQLKFTENILSKISPSAEVIVFDQNGKNHSSESFAKLVSQVVSSGKKEVFIITGGAFGLSPEVLRRANHKVCLAPFVMSHHIAEAVALEQVYRAFTIIKGLPYHNP